MAMLSWISSDLERIKIPLFLISLIILHLILYSRGIWNDIVHYTFIATLTAAFIYGGLFLVCYLILR